MAALDWQVAINDAAKESNYLHYAFFVSIPRKAVVRFSAICITSTQHVGIFSAQFLKLSHQTTRFLN
jgi:hypothetical protein